MGMRTSEIRVGIDRRSFLRVLAAGGAAAVAGAGRPSPARAATNLTAGWQVKWGGQLIANYPDVERRFDMKIKVGRRAGFRAPVKRSEKQNCQHAVCIRRLSN